VEGGRQARRAADLLGSESMAEEDFRLYPNGDGAFKEFIPGKTVFKAPQFSFDYREKPELGTARIVTEVK
jgi:hypothetical protein